MSAEEINIIWLSLKVALLTSVLTLPMAIWLGWILARKNMKMKPLLEAMISFPLVAPPVVTGYLLLVLLGRRGIIGSWLYEHLNISLSFNFSALVIASFVVSLPLAVRTIRSSFEMIDPAYESASRTLGATPLSTFFRVSLPMAIPGIIAGLVLSFARTLGEFGASITLAGNIIGKTQTISLKIYSGMQVPGQEAEVLRMASVSIVISFAAIIVSEIISRRSSYLINR
jgi:molybdate transport system permease protein